MPVNGRLVAIGQRQDGTVVTPLLYQSVDGRIWTRIDPEQAVFSTLTSITGNGTIDGRLVLAGSVPVSVTPTPHSNVFWTTDR